MSSDNFSQWLLDEIERRRMSYTEVGRLGGISHARISQVIAGEAPGKRFCRAIARAFRIPPEEVFRRAGILEPLPPTEEELELLRYLFNNLSEEDQRRVLAIARAFAGLAERED